MKKILIVEDDQDIVRALTIRLKAQGYEVVAAYDVIQGTAAAMKEKPDLAVFDISMPGGNGIVLAERLQQNPATAGLPVIFLTASKDPEIREKALAAGAVAFIEKPYDAQLVIDLVAETLGHRSAG